MIQATFDLEESHVRFLEQCRVYGFKDGSEAVRRALDYLRGDVEQQRGLQESATLYAEAYEEDEALKALTESAIAEWPL